MLSEKEVYVSLLILVLLLLETIDKTVKKWYSLNIKMILQTSGERATAIRSPIYWVAHMKAGIWFHSPCLE